MHRQDHLIRGATRSKESWNCPPEQVHALPYERTYPVEHSLITGGDIPGEEVQGRCSLPSQKVKQVRITDGEHGNMRTRAFIAEWAGGEVHQFGACMRLLVPVLHTGAECIMHISGEEDYAF